MGVHDWCAGPTVKAGGSLQPRADMAAPGGVNGTARDADGGLRESQDPRNQSKSKARRIESGGASGGFSVPLAVCAGDV